MFTIDYSKLHKLESAFIIYEVASHGVDPRETLAGTTLRIKNREGYKQGVYDELHRMIENGGPYTDILLKAFNNNLASYRQKPNIERIAVSEDAELLETALTDLYEGSNDESAFNELVDIIGGYFDVLGLIFFLKDCENYLPIRSELFDERFKQIGVASNLSHNCTWEKYQEYNAAIKEIHQDLRKNINTSITLIDAHSFIWVLNGVAKYSNSVNQPVEHKTLGKGVIIDSDGETITVKFSNSKNPTILLKSIAIDEGKLTFIDPGFDIDAPNSIKEKNSDLKNALANNKNSRPNKYFVIYSNNSKDAYLNGCLRAPYYNKLGRIVPYWDTLSELKPGDILFHYQYPSIRAVSIVSSSCYDVPISDLHGETEEWGDVRRQVEFIPFVLDESIKIDDYKDEIIKYKRDKNMNSAFNKNGGVVEGYVHELEPELSRLFEEAAGLLAPLENKHNEAPKVLGTYDSWTIKSETTAEKKCDKSVFEYHGSGIPRQIYWFFSVDDMERGERRDISLQYEGVEYKAYFKRETHELGRIQIFWYQDLADEFEDYYTPSNYPSLSFDKLSDDLYSISILSGKSSIKSEIEELRDDERATSSEGPDIDYDELQKEETKKEDLRQEQRDNEYPKRFAKDLGITVEDWLRLLKDISVFRENDIELVKKIYLEDNHATTLYNLSIKDGVSSNSYIFPVVYLGKRLSKALQLEPLYRDDGTRAWWRIPFWGRKRKDGHFEWKLRPELAKAIARIYPELDGVNINEEEDDQLVSDLKQSIMADAPSDFEYVDGSKDKAEPVFQNGHKAYPRDRQVSINALAHASFKCEVDNNHPTFIRKNSDKPYTEPHHLVPMAFSDRFDVSLDREQNIVSLCSNCHNEIHYGRDARNLVEKLYADRKELLSAAGIDISLDELLRMYGVKK